MSKNITKSFAKKLLPKRIQNSNKGTYGSILNIAGSVNYKGAAYLSTISALKTGAGYIAIASIEEVLDSVTKLCSEAVLYPLKESYGTIAKNEYKKIVKLSEKFKVLSFGCGISSINNNQKNIETFTKKFLEKIKNRENSIIIDADGLNIIAKLKIIDLPKNTILTPHPMELSRLLGIDINEIQKDRERYALETSKKYKSVIVLKGNQTVITDGKDIYINKTGNSSLSKAGTGDILTGMISGYCAQGLNCLNSAILGTYLHGLAGELASKELSEYSVNASDLIKYIPKTIKSIL